MAMDMKVAHNSRNENALFVEATVATPRRVTEEDEEDGGQRTEDLSQQLFPQFSVVRVEILTDFSVRFRRIFNGSFGLFGKFCTARRSIEIGDADFSLRTRYRRFSPPSIAFM